MSTKEVCFLGKKLTVAWLTVCWNSLKGHETSLWGHVVWRLIYVNYFCWQSRDSLADEGENSNNWKSEILFKLEANRFHRCINRNEWKIIICESSSLVVARHLTISHVSVIPNKKMIDEGRSYHTKSSKNVVGWLVKYPFMKQYYYCTVTSAFIYRCITTLNSNH